MYKKKNIGICILLSVITCGLYSFFWMAELADNVNTAANKSGTSGVMVVVLTLLTCGIYGCYWSFKSGETLDLLRKENNEDKQYLPFCYLVLTLFGLGLITFALMQSEVNKYGEDCE